MKVTVDTSAKVLSVTDDEGSRQLPLYSDDAFAVLSRLWVKVGWSQKYSYTFTWMGRPIIQLPEDVVRVQEVIYRTRPDVIIETGVAHGGSLVFYASLFKAMGAGRVVGIDIEIRPHNRAALEAHELSHMITLIEGSSTDPATVAHVRALVRPGERVMVILDSNHTKAHVLRELEMYHDLVSPGMYLVATDGIMCDVHDTPLGQPEWSADNPYEAARDFAAGHPEFTIEQPAWAFNESGLRDNITHWPGAWLLRRPAGSGTRP